MDSFQAKIGWERLRKRENKNYRSDKFLPNPKQRIKKKKKKQKNSKIKKTPLWLLYKQQQVGK